MTPAWLPVVGSGFDQVAAQNYNWANYNRGVDEANIGRQGAAQQNWNAYQWKLAEQERQDAQDALRAKALEREIADRNLRTYQWGQEFAENKRQFGERQTLSKDELTARLDADKQNRTDRRDDALKTRNYQAALDLLTDDPFGDVPKDLTTNLDPAALSSISAYQRNAQRQRHEDYDAVIAEIAPANAALSLQRLKRAREGVTDEAKLAAIEKDPSKWPAANELDVARVFADTKAKLGRLANLMEFKNGQFVPTMKKPGPLPAQPAPAPFTPPPAPPVTNMPPAFSWTGTGGPGGFAPGTPVPVQAPITPASLMQNLTNQPARSMTLDKATAAQFLAKAGGDKERARQMARQAGYSF